MGWRWAAASQIGTSHIRLGNRKQDAYACFEPVPGILCAVVCDGAGSAQFGGEGASVICRSLVQGLRSHFRLTEELPSDEFIWSLIDQARDILELAAKKRDVLRREFASTLLLAIASNHEALTVHVGDGAIVARDTKGYWRALSWPENGEYASTTYFITDDPSPRARIVHRGDAFDALSVFSDGIEDLALDQKAQAAYEPFFRSMLKPLDASTEVGRSVGLSIALADFLVSERVCERTDDDKTLILASRL